MRRAKWAAAWVACVTVLASVSPAVLGQQLGEGRVVISPGDMVSAGLGRAQAAVRDPFATTPITETAETIAAFDEPADPVIIDNPEDLIGDAIRQLAVNAISQLFATFANDFLTSIGLPALFPTDFMAATPDLSGLVQEIGTDQADGSPDAEEPGATEVPDPGTSDPDTSGGRGGRNGNRPRG